MDNKVKTLLLHLPQNLDDVSDYAALLQPYGLAMVSSVLKQNGCDVVLLDAFAQQKSRDEIIEYVKSINPDILGITVMTHNVGQTVQFLREMKTLLPKMVTVLGGIHASIEYQNLLSNYPYVDIAVIGEGELTMLELVESIQLRKPLQDIKGIAYREEGEVRINPFRENIQNLDSLPFADWESLPMEKYWDRWTIEKNYACLIVSRGCPFSCTFCGHSIIGKSYRAKSPGKVLEEIKLLYDRYNVRNLTLADSTLNVSNKWLRNICEGLINIKRPIKWGCSIRADHVDRETLALMKKSGCVKIFIGVESADNEMLKSMRKNESIEKIKEGIQMIKEAGLTPDLGFIIGMPGETTKSIMKTIEFARTFNKSVCSFTYATPYPGTELYEMVKKDGFSVEDWSKHNTYTLAYIPKGFTRQELQYYFELAVKSTYLRIPFLVTQLLNIRSYTNFKVNVKFAYRLFFKTISRKKRLGVS
ncbi:MAG: B12-binding domain-containing radical SAM protein [Candidatus Scalindua sp.]|nr:B12-binding domain-containing radical SAM protein [Candidatus Scalindua sp.]